MKHLKHFNESGDDIDFHIQQIEDVFLDVKDEFGLEKYVENKDDNGIFYSIKKWGKYRWLNKKTAEIRVWIANMYPVGIDNNILESESLKGFEDRLRNMGYTFKRTPSNAIPYYEIIIYIP